jgi:alkaline phosphatase D
LGLSAPAVLIRATASAITGFDPFPFSVASGDPTPDGMILWTRLARAADDPTPLGAEPIPVEWIIAADPAMGRIVARGKAAASPANGFSVHVPVRGLTSDRPYWYRFRVGGVESPVGRTRTLPAADSRTRNFRFNVASCQHWENGYFDAYDGMTDDDAAFVLHLGDYIYETQRGGVRDHVPVAPPKTLADYRTRHALYRTDPALRRAQERMPFIPVPDNHDASEWNDPDLAERARRTAAYQAWAEFMPSRCALHRRGSGLVLAQSIDIGRLLRMNVLDTRQFRASHAVCGDESDPAYALGIYRKPCGEVTKSERSMLGAAQLRWLEQRLRNSPAHWNVLASTVLMTPFAFRHNDAVYRYLAGWDGYPAERSQILNWIRGSGVSNPVSVSGDIHASLISTIGDAKGPLVTEFVGTSISSLWPEPLAAPMREALPANPHIQHFDPLQRGYLRCTVTEKVWQTDLRTIDSALHPGGRTNTDRSFSVESGRPGALPG